MTTIDEAIEEVAASPGTIDTHFPGAARQAGAEGRDGDAARAALLLALPDDAPTVVRTVERLYWHGDAAERRAVLLALPRLDAPGRAQPIGPRALPVVRDALRSNDTRLIESAMGPYAARHLDDEAWRQAVLKLLFVGIPVSRVTGLEERADSELGRMVGDYAAERRAAGRTVPDDVELILGLDGVSAPTHPALHD